MSKSIQPVDLANMLSSTPQTATNSGSEGDDGPSFFNLLSGHVTDQPGKGTGKSSLTPGNSLPEQALHDETRDPVMDAAMLAVEIPEAEGNPDIADTQFFTNNPELPWQPVESVPSQQVRAQDIPVTSQTAMDNKTGISGQEPATAQSIRDQTPAQALASTEQVMEQWPRTSIPAGVESIPAAVHSPGQPAEHAVQPPVELTGQQAPLSDRAVGQPVSLPGQVVDPRAQLLTQASGQQAQQRTVTQTAPPVGVPAMRADFLQKDYVTDASRLKTSAAAKEIPAGDAGRVSTIQEPVSSVVREAVQQAVASQTANSDMKPSLHEHRNSQPGANTLAALTRTDTNPLAFLQTLSESSPLALPSARVQVPVGQQGWGEAVGQQVAWFVSQNVSAANLRLNPQNLGPMEMLISMEGDKANVSFLSQHTVVRDALESSLPRLREMLAESGLDLVNVNISQHGTPDQKGRGLGGFRHDIDYLPTDSDFNETELDGDVQQVPVAALGLIDDYA